MTRYVHVPTHSSYQLKRMMVILAIIQNVVDSVFHPTEIIVAVILRTIEREKKSKIIFGRTKNQVEKYICDKVHIISAKIETDSSE